jgi:3-dehydroquinate dehydratase II
MKKKMVDKNKKKILVMHGPNLHLLGKRQPDVYGKFSLDDINQDLKKLAVKLGINLEVFQSNSEGEMVDKITGAGFDLLIINPAAYTHTSVAIRDAILAVDLPVIEVHLSNIYGREEFRKKSLISDIAQGVITGFGKQSYFLALEAARQYLKD